MKLEENEISALEGKNDWYLKYVSDEKKTYWFSLSQEQKDIAKDRAVRHLDFFESFKGSLEDLNEVLLEGDEDELLDLIRDGSNFVIGDYSYHCIEQFGGEGEGDSYWKIYRVDHGEVSRFFKFDGYHASHDGSYLNNVFEVKPKEKTITVYE